MKRIKGIFNIVMVLCLLFVLSACGENEKPAESTNEVQNQVNVTDTPEASEGPVEESQRPEAENNVLIAYFSATGNTKGVAERIAEITGGDLYEIVPAEPYTSEDLDYGNDQSRTSLEMDDPSARPEIGSETILMEGYDILYIGYPIWHGQAPRILSTFVESYDFDGITVIPFCTSGSSGIGNSDNQLAELAGSGNWLEGERFSSSVSVSTLQAWIDEIE